MSSPTVYLNGDYLPLSEARISVLDRGFLFGDGVYEVIPAYNGKLFQLSAHLQRLDNSLENIRLHPPHTHRQWQEILTTLLDDTPAQYLYLQVTRGIAEKRDHAFPQPVRPTVFAMATPIGSTLELQRGVKAITLDDSRWRLCHVKAITLLANILLRQQAVDEDCAEAILVIDDQVTEGAASNVFAVLDGTLTTPPNSNRILPGITRDVILQLARENRLPVVEAAISLKQLRTASEIWLTSSTREILPVVHLDGSVVGNGAPGPVWQSMNGLFQEYKQRVST